MAQDFKISKNRKIYCDVFGLQALGLAVKHKVFGVKIHSSDLENLELIKKIPSRTCYYHVVVQIYLIFQMLLKF